MVSVETETAVIDNSWNSQLLDEVLKKKISSYWKGLNGSKPQHFNIPHT